MSGGIVGGINISNISSTISSTSMDYTSVGVGVLHDFRDHIEQTETNIVRIDRLRAASAGNTGLLDSVEGILTPALEHVRPGTALGIQINTNGEVIFFSANIDRNGRATNIRRIAPNQIFNGAAILNQLGAASQGQTLPRTFYQGGTSRMNVTPEEANPTPTAGPMQPLPQTDSTGRSSIYALTDRATPDRTSSEGTLLRRYLPTPGEEITDALTLLNENLDRVAAIQTEVEEAFIAADLAAEDLRHVTPPVSDPIIRLTAAPTTPEPAVPFAGLLNIQTVTLPPSTQIAPPPTSSPTAPASTTIATANEPAPTNNTISVNINPGNIPPYYLDPDNISGIIPTNIPANWVRNPQGYMVPPNEPSVYGQPQASTPSTYTFGTPLINVQR